MYNIYGIYIYISYKDLQTLYSQAVLKQHNEFSNHDFSPLLFPFLAKQLFSWRLHQWILLSYVLLLKEQKATILLEASELYMDLIWYCFETVCFRVFTCFHNCFISSCACLCFGSGPCKFAELWLFENDFATSEGEAEFPKLFLQKFSFHLCNFLVVLRGC